MVKSYLVDPTTKFAELKELTRDDPSKNMLRQLAKTLMTDASWSKDMGDPSIPPTVFRANAATSKKKRR